MAEEEADKIMELSKNYVGECEALAAVVDAGKAVLADKDAAQEEIDAAAYDILNELAKLAKKAEGRTQIVITQRVTSAMNSDVIFVMDNGHLVDSGKHEELLSRCKIYKEIYASQTGGAEK